MEDYPMARLLRDSRLGPIGGGTSEILREIIAKIIICPILILIKKYFYFLERPIVQLVERAAHNGFVVGSNPARLIYISTIYT